MEKTMQHDMETAVMWRLMGIGALFKLGIPFWRSLQKGLQYFGVYIGSHIVLAAFQVSYSRRLAQSPQRQP